MLYPGKTKNKVKTNKQTKNPPVSLGSLFSYYIFKNLFTRSLLLCAGFLQLGGWGLLLTVVCGRLPAVAFLVERGLQAQGLRYLQHLGSAVALCTGAEVLAHWLSCPGACGIFLDQGSNPCPLYWQADS